MHSFNFDNSYLTLPSLFYTVEEPKETTNPHTLLFNEKLAESLDLPSSIDPAILAGSRFPKYAAAISQAYGGHQFGHYTTLGDGRALLLGEHITSTGARYDIHLKGSGRTAYSRNGDGRAALGPMLREYIISEAMHALNIPTTRSLAVTLTGSNVLRETSLKGAVLTRIAQSHIRVGTFEYAARIDLNHLTQLADYTIRRHYPNCLVEDNPYVALLETVVEQQASLIAKWQSIGFIHGVMNTDNMSIAGETIDYGPCAFMDEYSPSITFSSIDHAGRYSYDHQPGIGQWNLARFAETLLNLLDEDLETAKEIARENLQLYEEIYLQYWLKYMGEKIGIASLKESDNAFIIDLLTLLEEEQLDYTNTFRLLTAEQQISSSDAFDAWYRRWQQRLIEEESPYELMKTVNPTVIPRNHLVEQAIQAAYSNNMQPFNDLLAAVQSPFTPHDTLYYQLPKEHEKVRQTFCGT